MSEPRSLQLPDLNMFRLVSGPNQSYKTIIRNNRISETVIVSFILKPKKPGKYNIPPATFEYKGSKMRSNSLQLEVKNQGNSSGIHSSDKLSDKKAFIRVTADKKDVYYGEKVTLTYKVYFREVDMNLTPKFPPFRGFWAQDIPADQKALENINGVTYQTQVLRKVELFPQKSGALTIEPVTIEALIRKQGQPMDIFDRFFKDPFGDLDMHEYEKKLMQSNSLQINVKPLPELCRYQRHSLLVYPLKLLNQTCRLHR